MQVKCTSYRQPLRTKRNPQNPNGTRITLSRGAWRINLTCQSGHVPYRRHDFDLLAALILPANQRGSGRPRPERWPKATALFADDRRPTTGGHPSISQLLNRGIWYLIPASALPRRQQILLWPDGPSRYSRWEPWRERWDLLLP